VITEAELDEVLRHLEEAAQGGPLPAMYMMLLDAFRWVKGEPGTRFQSEVIEKCRRVDRAVARGAKAQDN
jgi:hypothetical protein